ncbi:hypothetical protein JCM19301_663 [Jejuia pallidilutea]|uniref:Uncharacterized protein n=1 Tax=Jejuia pallidilutea TaxID=504487 RepID=A0A090VQ21_9FLAO|nr:hypothetical protein JCM19301_663 [Jejuia pallidilutea]GAL70502.1 hypothetical protein JCM19302_1411 [Jejuia pallidilutea]GAL88133.1 hypothetical protein JCM19538_2496 [Jejuia pallidilutea]
MFFEVDILEVIYNKPKISTITCHSKRSEASQYQKMFPLRPA